MTPHFLTRTLALGAVALLATGCVSTGDPYYNEPPPYYRGYESGVMYPPGAYPVYPVAPPPRNGGTPTVSAGSAKTAFTSVTATAGRESTTAPAWNASASAI